MSSNTLSINIDSNLVERLNREAMLKGISEERLVNEYIEDKLKDKNNETILDELSYMVDLIDRDEETDAVQMKKDTYKRG